MSHLPWMGMNQMTSGLSTDPFTCDTGNTVARAHTLIRIRRHALSIPGDSEKWLLWSGASSQSALMHEQNQQRGDPQTTTAK